MDCIDSCHPRILLAEDNPINQRVAERMLANLGYPVDMAANGLEALQALEHQHYDVVLMDIQMPLMDGLEATRTIRRWLSARDQPRIIAVTAFALDYSREMCIDAAWMTISPSLFRKRIWPGCLRSTVRWLRELSAQLLAKIFICERAYFQ